MLYAVKALFRQHVLDDMRGSANAEGRMWLGGQDPLKSYVNACGGKQANWTGMKGWH